MIGDPSGRSDMRTMMTPEIIQHNCDCFKKQMSRFIDFSEGKAMMVNNAEWLMGLNYIEFLREVGPHFSVNNMLRAECYKQRMEKGLSLSLIHIYSGAGPLPQLWSGPWPVFFSKAGRGYSSLTGEHLPGASR